MCGRNTILLVAAVFLFVALGSTGQFAPQGLTVQCACDCILHRRTHLAARLHNRYELDPRPLSRSELAEMAAYVRLCRKLSHLVTGGDLYRLWDPFVETSAAWMYVLEGGLEAMVVAVNLSREVGRLLPHLRMRGLDATTTYAVEELVPGNVSRNPETGAIRTDGAHVYQLGAKMTLSGVTLMGAGLPIRFLFDGDSVLFHLYPHTA